MVVHIAADPWGKSLCIYDSEKEEKKYEAIVCNVTVREWQTDKVEEYFENIIHVINKPIDDLCLILNWDYYNEILKKFVEVSKKFDIKRLKIISEFNACGLGALKYIHGIPEVLLIFDCYRTQIMCTMWKVNSQPKISVSEFYSQTRASSDSTIEDVKKLLKKLNNPAPFSTVIVVYYFNEYDSVDTLQQAFERYSDVYFENSALGLCNILTTIQMQKEKKIFYDVQPLLNRQIEIKFEDVFIESLKLDCILPYQKEYVLSPKHCNSCLKIYEDGTLTQSIKASEKGTTAIVYFKIDIDGIYNVTMKRKKNSVTLSKPLKKTLLSSNNKTIFKIPSKLSNYNKSLHAVGVDLGSAECCAYVIRRHGPEGVVLDLKTGLRTMPSYVAIDELNNPCGQNVVDRMETKPQYAAFDVKRLMGKELNEIDVDPLWPYDIIKYCEQIYFLFDKENTPGIKSSVQISSCLLKHIKKMSDEYQSAFSTEVVITVPSSYTEKQKDATIDAANLIGWYTVHLLPEPIAAAIAYSYETDIPNESTILLFDCGDGTTDICIAKIVYPNIEIIIDKGNSAFGGKEFDKILIAYFGNILKNQYKSDVFNSNKKYRLMKKCREIKHALSTELKSTLHIDDFIFESNEMKTITRQEFEKMTFHLIYHGQKLIDETLAKANLRYDNIDIVFQVGGGCRMPAIKQMLFQIFQKAKHQCSMHPEELVAKGAALHAYELKTKKM